MEESKKLFSQRAIGIATFFGGPAAAGYLVKKNYQAFDQDDTGKKAFMIGIVSTILLFAGIFSIPEHIIDLIPNLLIPAIYTAIIYYIVEKHQGNLLKKHKESGGEFYSGWKATGIGAIFMLLMIGAIAGSVFLAGGFSHDNFDAVKYDKGIAEFSKNETKSLEVFNIINSAEPKVLIQEFSKGIVLWKENKGIVNKLNLIENLPSELKTQNQILLKYCDLRISQNEIIIKAISEDTDRYVSEIESIGSEIDKVLAELDK